MNRNFIRVCAANTKINLLDVDKNKEEILKQIEFAHKNHVDIISFPELALSGVSSGEMLCSQEILQKSQKALEQIIDFSKSKTMLISLGLSIRENGRLYSGQALIFNGSLLKIIKKNKLNKEQKSYLHPANLSPSDYLQGLVTIDDTRSNLAFIFEDDLFDDHMQYSKLINANSKIVFVAGSRSEHAASLDEKLEIFKSISKKDNLALIYSGPSSNESSTNSAYSGYKYIIEAGQVLAKSPIFSNGLIYTDINLDEISIKTFFEDLIPESNPISFSKENYSLYRKISQSPMIPQDKMDLYKKAKNILNIQAHGLIRRLNQISDKKIFLGLSGGLDSTLALISASYAFEKAAWDKKNIHAIIMPGLGTSKRTKTNAHLLANAYGVSVREISINDSVLQHFKDIGHDEDDYSIVYENAQARERTQILMDLANKQGGLVLGTGNMSEIALGFSTYNGDHMSMYAINSGLSKTLLREVVRFVMEQSSDPKISLPLADIIETPISPELLPSKNGQISQKTEDKVGPYDLHDFFLYHTIRNKSAFEDVLFMSKIAFEGRYSIEDIEKWYTIFLRRFSTQQFKRSCMPDGPAIEDFSLNPRNGFTMASDINILKWR
ncbi:MAG: NAD(+) synthase [Tissierellia bacterium]|nr:NAD(+) synthase [Tissierellia bacterium]